MTDHRGPRRRRQGELEVQVLAALREADGPATAGWVRQRLGGDLAYTTVITILTRLLAKGAVTRERAGRSFAWTPASDGAG
ncbi:BlaI/MecI/CopY family transcriptional regulator, partial [Streptomyces sp. NPDC086077]|uniref:BlaI/MecI/CopY family transcriptional regulator n=1 Tax=Streptomyces sp. NPDC086077 TaxID=3154862 RepID=UPI00343558A7